jgi:hypothetical protein
MENLHIKVLKTVSKQDLLPSQPADTKTGALPLLPPPILHAPATLPAATPHID